jgi:hypothetical protein
MPRTPYLVQDEDGQKLDVLVSVRERWRVNDLLVIEGKRLRVLAVVALEPNDSSGCAAALTVKRAA